MTIPGSANPLLLKAPAGGGEYAIERSVRFNSSDSAYYSKSFASAGNRKTWTWAGWVKRGSLGTRQILFSCGTTYTAFIGFFGPSYSSGDNLFVNLGIGVDAAEDPSYTNAVLRDQSAWYHIVVSTNTSSALESDRLKIYINGVIQSRSGTITLNRESAINSTINAHTIGVNANGQNSLFFNGYLADIHFIDGQALDPTSFGEFDDNGIWQPIAYSGSYGTNGFHLPFSDNSTAAALGTDSSGAGNTWTINNLSVTAGAGNDSLVDVPTNGSEVDTGAGGQVRGNYATLNPLALGGSLANGNLDFTSSGAGGSTSTVGVSSGKWYWEVYIGSTPTNTYVGLYDNPNNLAGGYAITGTGGNRFTTAGGTFTVTSGTFQVGDIFGVAANIDAGTVTWYRNGSVAVTLTGATLNTKPWFSGTNVNAAASSPIIYNFGQRPFAYTAPSGFKALCTANLPAPVVTKPSTVMDVKLYTGNGGTQTISGLNMSPDLVWLKARATVGVDRPHQLFDTVRGAPKALSSNRTDAEDSSGGYDNDGALTAFTSDGFTVENGPAVNSSSSPYVAWTWDAGSSTVTNTVGSITSSVRANATAGFAVIGWSGAASGTATIGHGLGVAPSFMVMRPRTGTSNWAVYHKSIGNDAFLRLNTTDASVSSSACFGTGPTSTVFTINQGNLFGYAADCICYAFSPVTGYSSFGSYTGNGSADGPFVFTNHRPRWILLKRTDTASNWTIIDTAREGYNVDNDLLYPNLSDAESTTDLADILSNGFKLRSADASVNANAGAYIYASFAEQPFALARAR